MGTQSIRERTITIRGSEQLARHTLRAQKSSDDPSGLAKAWRARAEGGSLLARDGARFECSDGERRMDVANPLCQRGSKCVTAAQLKSPMMAWSTVCDDYFRVADNQRLPPSLLIENASGLFIAFQRTACPRRFRSRLATIRFRDFSREKSNLVQSRTTSSAKNPLAACKSRLFFPRIWWPDRSSL